MTNENIEYYFDIAQGSDEWLRLKHGVLSASTFKNIITAKTLKLSMAQKSTLFFDDILSQRIDETLQPNFVSYDMQRGLDDEPFAVQQYAREYDADYKYCGFVINNSLGFPLGFSPDALIGDDGFIEIKSKMPKRQVQCILDHVCGRLKVPELIPSEFMMQVQAGLFVTERDWCDFISFSNGLQMVTIRVFPIPAYQDAIQNAAIEVERYLREMMGLYEEAVEHDPRLTLTPRRIIDSGEMV
jgi:hypothetical protein